MRSSSFPSKLKSWILGFPQFYKLFDYIVGKFGWSRCLLFARYVPYAPGVKVLDLGCGPGNSCRFFQPSDYLGIDIDQAYIENAKEVFPRFDFLCLDFLSFELPSSSSQPFDLVLAIGLLHHIDDDTAVRYLSHANKLLADGGRLLLFDGTIYQGQPKINRSVVSSDRGQFIRAPDHYIALLKASGFSCNSVIAEDLLLIPHSLLILSAQK